MKRFGIQILFAVLLLTLALIPVSVQAINVSVGVFYSDYYVTVPVGEKTSWDVCVYDDEHNIDYFVYGYWEDSNGKTILSFDSSTSSVNTWEITFTKAGTYTLFCFIDYYDVEKGEDFSETYQCEPEVVVVTNPITNVSLTITAPQAGAKPDYHPILPSGAHYYSDAYNTEYFRNDVKWLIADTEKELPVNSTIFKTGVQYMVDIYLTPESGYHFKNNIPCTINGQTVAGRLAGNEDGQIEIVYTFPPLSTGSGWQQIGEKWYYYKNGTAVTGWQKISNKWYYFSGSGAMLSGWQKISGKWYYLNNDMKTGWQKISGKWYYLNNDMKTGWLKYNNKWYYLGTEMKTGWQKISSKWYYFDGSGVMQSGWLKYNNKWYYLGNEMKTGWQKISSKWYYFDGSGVMQTGWLKYNNKWYYLGTNGAMVTGTQVINGKTYTFDSSGVWVN